MAKNALVVDDDPIIRNLMSTLLRRRGIGVSQAVNGEEAIALVAAQQQGRHDPFDLIVLDMMMPKASGWDVLAFVEKEAPAMLTRVLVVSAAGETALGEVVKRGCGRILHKPFEVEEFYAAILHCLSGPREEAEGSASGGTGGAGGDASRYNSP